MRTDGRWSAGRRRRFGRRGLVALVAALLGLAWATAAPAQADTPIESIEQIGTIDLGPDAVDPDEMVLVDDRYLYVSNEGENDSDRGGSIFIIDLTTGDIIDRQWFDDRPWFLSGHVVDLYQGDNGYIYASFPTEGHLVIFDPTLPVGAQEINDIDLQVMAGDPHVYNQSVAAVGDTIFVADDDGRSGVIMMPLDGSSMRTYPLTEDARPFVPADEASTYVKATAEAIAVSPDGAFVYVGAHLRFGGTDGRGLFMAYSVGSDGSLNFEYAMLCEVQELIHNIIVTPQHIYAPSNIFTSLEVDYNVYVFDNNAGTVTASGVIGLDATVQTSYLSTDGLLYVTFNLASGGAFVVIDPTVGNIGEVVYEVSRPDERMVGLAFSSDGTRIYVSNYGDNYSTAPAPIVMVYALTRQPAPDPGPGPLPDTGAGATSDLLWPALGLTAAGLVLLLVRPVFLSAPSGVSPVGRRALKRS
jgi:DNA-binding beta-propeller fold protein YncE